MSPLWVWVEDLAASASASGGVITLSSDEARHVSTRRLRVGETLVAFDGEGRTAQATVSGLARRAVTIEVEAVELAPAPDSALVLATAIPKGDRLSTMLQMCTQLGLEVWQPLVLEDSAIRTLDVEATRLRRVLIEGCKVARRPWAMRVLAPRTLADAIERCEAGATLLFGDQAGSAMRLDAGQPAWLFIGPEAGFSEAERATLRSVGARGVSLGQYNLRIETAAVAAMAAFHATTCVR